jgi:hypothetical protein
MGELYDAASGQAYAPTSTTVVSAVEVPAPSPPSPPIPSPPSPQAARPAPPASGSAHPGNGRAEAETSRSATSTPDSGDLDGARLIALNMALNGESRAEADRYLAENFQLADRQKLIDEVYAAIEG